MNNKIIVFFSLLLLVTSCKSKNSTQGKEQKILWIEELKIQFKEAVNQEQQIILYKYKNQYVYLVDACYQCPDAMSFVYDKEKNKLCEFGGIIGVNSCPDFNDKAEFIGYEYNDVKKDE